MNADHLGVVDGVPTGVATILVASSTGQNKIVIVPGNRVPWRSIEKSPLFRARVVFVGANALFSAERVDAGKDVFEGGAAAVVVGTEASHDGAIRYGSLHERGLTDQH